MSVRDLEFSQLAPYHMKEQEPLTSVIEIITISLNSNLAFNNEICEVKSAHVPSFFGNVIAALGIALLICVLSEPLDCCLRPSQAICSRSYLLSSSTLQRLHFIHDCYKVLPPRLLHFPQHHQLLTFAALLLFPIPQVTEISDDIIPIALFLALDYSSNILLDRSIKGKNTPPVTASLRAVATTHTLCTVTSLVYHQTFNAASLKPPSPLFKMDTHTHDAVSKSVKVAKQQDLLATEAQINDTSKHTTDSTVIGRAKAKHDRKLAKAADAALHNARQGHDDCKMASRKTRYAESQFPFFRLPAEIRGNVVWQR
jgi:hypothetical protein